MSVMIFAGPGKYWKMHRRNDAEKMQVHQECLFEWTSQSKAIQTPRCARQFYHGIEIYIQNKEWQIVWDEELEYLILKVFSLSSCFFPNTF